MTAPNRSTLWGRILVDELAKGGLEAVCLAPGSRSTPLTVAFSEQPDIEVYSHLDERSAAFFALGRARRNGESTALVCTSGTAAANFHPAVIEADRARVPLLVLTADRPPELRDSGANQTIDQRRLYGNAVRWNADLPEPNANERTVRSLRTTAARALSETHGVPPGPVHLNCPFPKPLEPTPVSDAIPERFVETLAGSGREDAFVETSSATQTPDSDVIDAVARTLATADRPLIVGGPSDPEELSAIEPETVVDVAARVGAPILADPLSSLRFGLHQRVTDAEAPGNSSTDTRDDRPLVYGGYDSYVDALPAPDTVLRFGASPTSKSLRHALRDAEARQFLIDPAGGWREATFTATDLVSGAPSAVFERLRTTLEERETNATDDSWLSKFADAEARHWSVRNRATTVDSLESDPFEGAILASVLDHAPDPATVFVSNSMPIRDADRFGRPREAELTLLANRGASGIDGITSTALGAASATDDPLVLVTGDLAFYHDSNGLLAVGRCDVDATIVLLDNDGGGIFHKLPIEEFDPPFTDQFKTPHGLDFEALAEFYGLAFEQVEPAAFEDAYRRSLESTGTQILSVSFDSDRSHDRRRALKDRTRDGLASDRR
ncbi:2-succinyl-5-enolpyruvyl-6-hydroxy-3-cyclohexene-1-carboxylic-acid synthase [Natrarchaeobius halalkaliphilus]|uniref:2-succinyl-5-enolpyruvyl-6-hydroxy-3-cyclohexene-1-carboxylate synthase n=1 Tax=Natrarchaeobius halalkaliphilus TaxID=1679091 RepID=A0A3N6LRP1_9EURY|nr:2-succinyl-5-enolpyruvyl-6-hydroxy-3-cyclohexene-1-carboxylic-acid synthase [Natrarchaeobius halalkaliphilus]RQG89824.1 2-succinyl-5-enolpyruvyl-6-hydroxy-3-cyclohexene-1-carboxylic-acid synthase [Natrarchaeobius halalkaliphilus]